MRQFVAIEVPGAWRAEGARVQQALPASVRPHIRLIDTANMHVTLRFIGEVDGAALPTLHDAFGHALPPVHLDLSLNRIGTFGAPAGTSVVWLGVGGDLEGLRVLAQRAGGAVATALGTPPEERPYSPHITLGRVRRQVSSLERQEIVGATQAVAPPAGLPFTARDAVLIRSRLGPRGSRYEVLGRWG